MVPKQKKGIWKDGSEVKEKGREKNSRRGTFDTKNPVETEAKKNRSKEGGPVGGETIRRKKKEEQGAHKGHTLAGSLFGKPLKSGPNCVKGKEGPGEKGKSRESSAVEPPSSK